MGKREGKDEKGLYLKGNKVAKISAAKLDELVDLYCHHRAQGKDKLAFTLCDYRTIEKNATVLHIEKIRVAEAKGLDLWATICQNTAFGLPTKIRGQEDLPIQAENVNPTLMIFMMKAKFRDVYGEPRDNPKDKNSNRGEAKKQSTPFTVIDPETNEVIKLSLGAGNKKTT